ncbi:hypothetical protein Rsub_03706 [Raphidocelis subcapitata]|uniref:dCTP pyrophosphatase 1 n=1 Tax=Raphidocelis subcapitata TaxID=307507 RepID=A0A2V0NVZ3_9CHLO|nr:hypothetical protein Rsub_03706 [Raphidocelis subcapitata]|eukprot:GBF90852.1 hypothetical protein Rsub_03706 [Raphidocelis subcapitata]
MNDAQASRNTRFSELSLEEVRARISSFAEERDWRQYHTPRNLLLALVGEVGEAAEIFQWRPDSELAPGLPSFEAREREHLGEELSDVLLYLVRLADVCGVDLAAAVVDKLGKNAAKYPADKCRGRADKYSAYVELKAAAKQAAADAEAEAKAGDKGGRSGGAA